MISPALRKLFATLRIKVCFKANVMSNQQPNIFITGAAGGFGRAVARKFAKAGWYIGLYDLEEAPLRELANELGDSNCCYGVMDVTEVASVRKGIAHFGQHTNGTLTVLFNNAGIVVVGPFEEVSIEDHKKVIDVNFFGPMNVAHAALPLMRKTTNAHIINVSSASALHGNPELVSYSATKRAILSFTESLDIGLEESGIAASDILPMYATTPIALAHLDKYRKLKAKDVKLTPQDIAEATWRVVQNKKFRTYLGADTKVFGPLSGLLPYGIRKFVTKKVIGW